MQRRFFFELFLNLIASTMIKTDLLKPFSNEELDSYILELDALPSDEAMDVETLDGYLTGVAVMAKPKAITSLYLAMLGQETLNNEQLAHYLLRRQTIIAKSLTHENLSNLDDSRALQPVLLDFQVEDEAVESDTQNDMPRLGELWATGFLIATEEFEEEWRLEDEIVSAELEDMLAPMIALASPEGELPADLVVKGTTREVWLAQAIWSAYELWEYWRYHAPKPKTLPLQKAYVPNRNDACSCGSGKKYKQCCVK